MHHQQLTMEAQGWICRGDCKDDDVGIETSENLGRRVARVALKLHRGEKW